MKIHSPATLGVMRRLNEENLPHTAIIEANVVTTDAEGVEQNGWQLVTESPCRLRPITAKEKVVADKVVPEVLWLVVLPVNTPVEDGHRIIVAGVTQGEPWTRTVYVSGIEAPRTNEVLRNVNCVGERIS